MKKIAVLILMLGVAHVSYAQSPTSGYSAGLQEGAPAQSPADTAPLMSLNTYLGFIGWSGQLRNSSFSPAGLSPALPANSIPPASAPATASRFWQSLSDRSVSAPAGLRGSSSNSASAPAGVRRSGGVFGSRVACGYVNNDGTGGRKYCEGSTPVCCIQPSNSVGSGTCGESGCPWRRPLPPPPPRECPQSCDLSANHCLSCKGPFPRAAGKKYYTGACYPRGGDILILDKECEIKN